MGAGRRACLSHSDSAYRAVLLWRQGKARHAHPVGRWTVDIQSVPAGRGTLAGAVLSAAPSPSPRAPELSAMMPRAASSVRSSVSPPRLEGFRRQHGAPGQTARAGEIVRPRGVTRRTATSCDAVRPAPWDDLPATGFFRFCVPPLACAALLAAASGMPSRGRSSRGRQPRRPAYLPSRGVRASPRPAAAACVASWWHCHRQVVAAARSARPPDIGAQRQITPRPVSQADTIAT